MKKNHKKKIFHSQISSDNYSSHNENSRSSFRNSNRAPKDIIEQIKQINPEKLNDSEKFIKSKRRTLNLEHKELVRTNSLKYLSNKSHKLIDQLKAVDGMKCVLKDVEPFNPDDENHLTRSQTHVVNNQPIKLIVK